MPCCLESRLSPSSQEVNGQSYVVQCSVTLAKYDKERSRYNIRVDTILLEGLHELADLFGPGGGDQSSGVKSLTMKLVDNQTFVIRCSIR